MAVAGGPYDADQPVLLTTAREAPNRAACLMAIDGAEVAPDEVGRAGARLHPVRRQRPEAASQVARGQWKALTGAGCAAQYWSEEGGALGDEGGKPAARLDCGRFAALPRRGFCKGEAALSVRGPAGRPRSRSGWKRCR